MIEELKENNIHTNIQNIEIQLRNISTAIGSVDYGNFLNFLVQQRLKNEEKIDNLKEAFDEI